MNPRISLAIGIVLAALSVVPAAFGEGRLAGSPEPVDAVAYFKANELATAADATMSRQSPDAIAFFRSNEHATAAESDITAVGYLDAHERAEPPVGTTTVSAAPSGGDIEWGQLGIGFGLGIVLVAGLWLATRMVKLHPLAH